MSACSNTLRALSRSRIPTHKTLLPFLYQTATIQQLKHAAQPIARRNISRYSPKDGPAPTEDVPFEDKDSLPPALDDLESPRKTTITGSERAAFEKLYRKFNTRGSRQKEKDHEVEIDAIADEYWEPDEEEDPESNLDKIFDEALKKGAAVSREWNRSGAEQLRSRKPRQDLTTMAEHVLKGTSPQELKVRDSRAKGREEASASAIKLKKARLLERGRIDALLTSAKSDRELWETLHRQVFDQVRALDLDSTTPKKRETRPRNSKAAQTPASTDPKILFSNYPHHLLTALTTLRTHFPASALPMTLLPTIKALGRSSYALGATTALYTHLLRTAWLQQSSYPLIVSLLTDMHNGAIEFSADVLGVLDQVIKEFEMARSGRLGREMQMVYGMEQFGEGIREVRRWRAIVAERVGVEDGKREKGTVPVPRRRRAEIDKAEHVPLVEGSNGAAESAQEQVQGEQAQPAEAPEPVILVHDVDAGVDFGFLGEESAEEVPRTEEANGEPSAQVGESQEQPDAQAREKLDDEVKDNLKEEQDKTADESEATAKTSSGEPVPWTPS
ncbi:uncharacterized protein M421DRAFT_418586 [Didymella exigua CBS 183.55]|uniref:Mtf2-like C-terminal domain-containing protein n=1 Tax=Didymella exigua CBS 183.55 TaxID=1150837 RepID=A0A6A5RRM0_9PLEO|nr:uncharacterized protein M421DRAFT_418586 [Didymella exigua CBS 183.55]KAF1930269.1 hypothetical protein M421DRAFT_418586 [Didymella exigua CBS 183.55]